MLVQDKSNEININERNYKKTPDKMRYVIKTPSGTVEYDVPIMKVQEYTLEDIFSKGLLLLIPFYIFSHEKNFKVYNNEQKLAVLKAEYRSILERLDKLKQERMIGAFDKRTIIELSGDVIREMACFKSIFLILLFDIANTILF